MTDILRRTRTPNRSVIWLVAAAFAGMLATFVAANTASAATIEQLQNYIKMRDLDKPKVRAGSLPGHPDKMISAKPKKPPPAPTVRIVREPNPDEPGYVAPVSRGKVHRYQDTVCHDGTCVSE
jgi:hypothetical protein